MYLTRLISVCGFVTIILFSVHVSALDCESSVDEQGEIPNQVTCDDGKDYNLTPLDMSLKIKKRLEEATLLEKQLLLNEKLIDTYDRKDSIHESMINVYKKKSELDTETVNRLMAITLEEEPFYKTNEFSFAVGAVTVVAAFVLWRYTEQFME